MEVQLTSCLVDVARGLAQWPDRLVVLTTKEAALFRFVAARPGRAVTREEILREVWGYRAMQSRTLEVTMRRLRQKVEQDPSTPRHLITVFGEGYRFEPMGDVEPVRHAPAPQAVARHQTQARDPDPIWVGRGSETDLVRRRLEMGFVVTIVGAPGMGKTRLARRVAVADTGRVVWCDLSGVTDPLALFQLIAGRLGVDPRGLDPGEIGALLQGDLLVVLDNVENVVPWVAGVLAGRGDARVLVTSQEPLRIEGESMVRLDRLGAIDAAALFRRRLVAAGGDDPAEDDLVNDVVERVDRNPLGIELAAAHAAAVGVRAVRDRLVERPLGLKSARRDTPARHRALRDAIQASWDRLSDSERAAMAVLASVRGSIPAELAERLVGGAEVDSELLTVLADKSLVVIEDVAGVGGDDTHVRVSDLVRAFVREVRPDVVPPHLILDVAEQWAAAGRRHDDLALARLASIAPTVREAFLSDSDPVTSVRAVLILDVSLSLRGPRAVRGPLIARGLAAAADVPSNMRARLYLSEGEHLRWTGGTVEVEGRFRAALAEPGIDHDTRMAATLELAELSNNRSIGEDPLALIHRVEALVVDDPFWRAMCELSTGAIVRMGEGGDYERARTHFLRAHAGFKEAGGNLGQGLALSSLGIVAAVLGHTEEALAAYAESTALLERGGYRDMRSQIVANQGLLLAELGQYAAAEACVREAIEEFGALGNLVRLATNRELLGIVLHGLGRYDESELEFRRSLEGSIRYQEAADQSSAMGNLALLLWRMGRVEDAGAMFAEVIARVESGAATPVTRVFVLAIGAAFAAKTGDASNAALWLAGARAALPMASSAATRWTVRIVAAAVQEGGRLQGKLREEAEAVRADPAWHTATDVRFLVELLERDG